MRSSGTASPTFRSLISDPPDDVGPGTAHDLGTVLVDGDGLEDVEALAVFLLDRKALGAGRDLVSGADRLTPLEDLAAVDHGGEVHLHVGVEEDRAEGR